MKFLNDVLRGLDTVFRFPGGLRGSAEMDLSAPIQQVVNVADFAIGEATLYVLEEQSDMTLVAGTAVFGNFSAENALSNNSVAAASLGLSIGDLDAYVEDIVAFIPAADTGNFGNLMVSIIPPADPNYAAASSPLYKRRLFFANTEQALDSESPDAWFSVYDNTARRGYLAALPARADRLEYRLIDGGAATCGISMRTLWGFYPKGTRPLTRRNARTN